MNTLTRLLASFFGGEILTLVTGLVPNTPAMLVGAEHYGYPLPWLIRMIVAPWYNPWRIDLLGFSADVIVWFVIIFIVLLVWNKVKK